MGFGMNKLDEIPDSLLDLIYDAAGDVGVWNSVLAAIAQLLDSAGGVLYGQSIQNRIVFFENNGGLSDEASRVYKARHIRNAWSLHMMVQPEGLPVASDDFMALSALRKTAFYDDVLRPQGLAHSAMMGLAARSKFVAAFNICRSPRHGAYGRAELAFLARLAPHMQRSLRLGFRLDAYRALQCAQFDILDRLAMGVILLDRLGAVLYCNRAARDLTEDGSALMLRGRRVSHASPSSARRLEALVAGALSGTPLAGLTIPAGEDDVPVTVLATPVRGSDSDRFSDGALSDAAVILFVSAPGAATQNAGWIGPVFGLTAAEAAVAAAAATGLNVPGIARRLNVSPNTVKTHLRRIFAKTGAKGQTELVRLVMPPSLVAGPDRDLH